MLFRQIRVYRYRNLKDQALDVFGGLNIFQGPNGAGKTNLLEAFCVCSGWGAFDRTNRLPRIGEPLGAVRCEAMGEEELVLGARLSGRVALKLNGRKASASEVRSRMPVLAFLPENMAMVEGPPSRRRRLLDLVCAICYPVYAQAIHRYGRALRQRMASLRSGRRELYTLRLMAAEGAVIWGCRLKAARVLTEASEAAASRLGIDAKMEYVNQLVSSNTGLGDPKLPVMDVVFRVMESSLEKEMRVMRPVVGPHRDDIRLTVGGIEASWALSRGQRKRLSSALVMGAASAVRTITGRSPVVVLDEVLSELDRFGRESLCRGLSDLSSQVLVSTAEEQELGYLGSVFRVEEGVISPLAGMA